MLVPMLDQGPILRWGPVLGRGSCAGSGVQCWVRVPVLGRGPVLSRGSGAPWNSENSFIGFVDTLKTKVKPLSLSFYYV